MLSVRRGTVKSRTSRALARLRTELGEARMSELGLEQRLVDLGRELEWPGTPRFDLGFDRRPERRARGGPLALALAVVVAVLGAVLALSPDARSAFLELFHLKGATVELVETLPAGRAAAVRLRRAGQPGGGRAARRLRARRPRGEAGRDLRPRRPAGVARLRPGRQAKARALAAPSGVWDGFVKKVGATGTRVEPVRVDGERGLFVSGDEHFVMFRDSNGAIRDDMTYLAGTVLLWNRGDLCSGSRATSRANRRSRSPAPPGREPVSPRPVYQQRHPDLEVRMKKLLFVLAVALVAVPVGSAGGWATVGLSSLPPSGLEANQAWPVDITVLQHGQTPLAGVTPIVRIRDDGGKVVDTFTARRRTRPAVTTPSSGSRARARTRTRSTTASPSTEALRRTRSSRSRSARRRGRSRTCPSGSCWRSRSGSPPGRSRTCAPAARGRPSPT